MFRSKFKEELTYTRAFVEKTNLTNVQVFPIPQNLENWIEIVLDPTFNYVGKVYNIDKECFEVCLSAASKVNLIKRKSAYTLRSDPMFIEFQFDKTELAEKAWRDEVLAIKAQYPIT
jgi:hypothetical protein